MRRAAVVLVIAVAFLCGCGFRPATAFYMWNDWARTMACKRYKYCSSKAGVVMVPMAEKGHYLWCYTDNIKTKRPETNPDLVCPTNAP